MAVVITNEKIRSLEARELCNRNKRTARSSLGRTENHFIVILTSSA